MTPVSFVVVAVMALAAPLSAFAAQQGAPPVRDSMPMRSMRGGMRGGMRPGMMRPGMGAGMGQGMAGDTSRQRMLRGQVEQRFGQMVQTELQLNDGQAQQLKTVMQAHRDRRRVLAQSEMTVQRAIRGQMQPGVAANQDSLNRLLDNASRLRLERAQQDQQFERDLTFLTPVQRARFLMMVRNLEDKVQDLRRHRAQGAGMGMGMGMGVPRDSMRRRPE